MKPPVRADRKQNLADSPHWASPVSKLKVTDVPEGALNLNVEGRRVVGPLQGFGQLWQKTFRVRLSGVELSPAEVMKTCKEKVPFLMPPDSRFYPSVAGVAPGRGRPDQRHVTGDLWRVTGVHRGDDPVCR